MENSLIQQFTNSLFGNVRVLMDDKGEPWFVGSDVASCLRYEKTRNAIEAHVDQEDKTTININTALNQGGNPGNPNMVIINESGLYSLIFSSKLPAAKEFKHWVTSEVLPAMRKIGFDRSMQLLQEENAKMQNQIAYLNHEIGEWGGQHQKDVTEFKYFIHWLIKNPYIPVEMKLQAWNYDPDPEGVLGVDIDADINNFVNTYIRGNNSNG